MAKAGKGGREDRNRAGGPSVSDRAILALDIGTRKVAGIVADPAPGGSVNLVAWAWREQEPGSMQDGQIHDIPAVARTVRQVCDELERRTHRPWTEAVVAVAGRSLRTTRGLGSAALSLQEPVEASLVQALELQALQDAWRNLAQGSGNAQEHLLCVGYTPAVFRLDGMSVPELVGHRGTQAEVEVIATFLPRRVVDSLLESLRRAGLAAAGLTLEPIAALDAAVPASMRRLNLALVDIGAGTSDIAITAGGTVAAYGMVPVAGDEITDALCQRYVLDFPEGERVKRALGSQLAARRPQAPPQPQGPPQEQVAAAGRLSFTDVLGQTWTFSAAEIQEALRPALEQLAQAIARAILPLNGGRPPQAVICVGGGSMTPGLPAALAQALELPVHRVGLRTRQDLEREARLSGCPRLDGPASVTPLGIALAGLRGRVLRFTSLTINGQPVQLLPMAGNSVGQALLAAGFPLHTLLPRPGPGITVEVNGQLVMLPGGRGEAAVIRRQGRPVRLDDSVREGDVLEVTAARPGEPAKASCQDLLQRLQQTGHGSLVRPLSCRFQGQPVQVPPMVWQDGRPLGPDDPVRDGGSLKIVPVTSVGLLLQALGQGSPENGKSLRVNGQPATLSTPLQDGDAVEIVEDAAAADPFSVPAAAAQKEPAATVDLPAAPAPVPPAPSPAPPARQQVLRIHVNGRVLTLSRPASTGDGETFPGPAFILSDIFRVLNMDAGGLAGPAAQGAPHRRGPLLIEVNGRPAGFTTPLNEGDQVRIQWEDKDGAP